MSFDYNPYTGIELIRNVDFDGFQWHCHSCGGNGKLVMSDINQLWADWFRHIRDSHKLTPEDVKDWNPLG